MRHVKDDQRVIWLWRERERERELFGRLGSQPSGNIVASKASHRAAANVINIQHVFYSNLVNTLPMFYIVLTNHRKFLLSRSISCILLLLRSTSLKHRPICGSPCHVPSLRERTSSRRSICCSTSETRNVDFQGQSGDVSDDGRMCSVAFGTIGLSYELEPWRCETNGRGNQWTSLL